MAKLLKNSFLIFIDFIEIAVICTVIFTLVYFFLGQLLVVTGDSMHPTLLTDEQIIADKASLKFSPLQRGEIVVFKHPVNLNRLLIKRIIAIEGDKVRIINGDIYINDEILNEKYLETPHSTLGGKSIGQNNEIVVPKNNFMLLGDNRENSADSREFGFVNKENIVGRAFMVYYPFDKLRIIKHE